MAAELVYHNAEMFIDIFPEQKEDENRHGHSEYAK